jgi:hypothetical protein
MTNDKQIGGKKLVAFELVIVALAFGLFGWFGLIALAVWFVFAVRKLDRQLKADSKPNQPMSDEALRKVFTPPPNHAPWSHDH